MVATQSLMLALGTSAPDFRLQDYHGNWVERDDFRDARAFLVAFICPHCPFVKHLRAAFAQFAREYSPRNIAIVAITSNDIETYPQDGPEGMRQEAREAGYGFPYLFDETQNVARTYGATCTPDFFLFDHNWYLVYRGQFDDSRPGNNVAVTGIDIRNACDALLSSQPVSPVQKPSIGCNIKWKQNGKSD